MSNGGEMKVPDGWEELLVKDAFSLGRGRVISKPEINQNPGIYPVYSSQSMNEGRMGSINSYDFDGEYITWTTDGAYAGTVFYRNGKFNCTNVCGALKDNGKHSVYPRFVASYLQTVAKNHVSYVGNPKLMNNTFGEISFILPPLPEQKKIAAILTSVDDVIEKTEAQISKLQDLKKGMMTELLTKGIGHTEFKDSPVGRIPKSWDVKKLKDLSVNGISNGVFRDPKKVGKGYKLINVFDMYQGFGVDPKSLELIDISEKEFANNRVEFGDVFFTRSSLKLEGIAYCNIWLVKDNSTTYDGHLMRIRPDQHIVIPEYLTYYCLSGYARTFFMSSAKHSTMTTISQTDIAPLLVVIPSIEEQKNIVQYLNAVQNIISSKELLAAQTKALKKALMNDLLTGKKRVNINN